MLSYLLRLARAGHTLWSVINHTVAWRDGHVLSARSHYNTVNAGPGLCLPQIWGDKHAGRGEKGAKPQGNASLLLYIALTTTVWKLIKVHGALFQRGMFDHYHTWVFIFMFFAYFMAQRRLTPRAEEEIPGTKHQLPPPSTLTASLPIHSEKEERRCSWWRKLVICNSESDTSWQQTQRRCGFSALYKINEK